MRTERGQAMMELACGMLALAIVVSALCGFAVYIVRSLVVQNSARSASPQASDGVDVGIFLGGYTIERLGIDFTASMPSTTILK